MSSYRIKEIICIALLLVFIFVLTSQNKKSDADAETVFEQASDAMDTDGLQLCSNQKILEAFGVSPSDYEAIYYLAAGEVMDVRELLVVKVGEGGDEQTLLSNIESRIDDKIGLFEGYAPEQAALLKKYRTETKNGFVLFVVSDDAAGVVRAFRRAV